MTTAPLTDGERRAMLLGAQRMTELIAKWLDDNAFRRRFDFPRTTDDGETTLLCASVALTGGKGPPPSAVIAPVQQLRAGMKLRDRHGRHWTVLRTSDLFIEMASNEGLPSTTHLNLQSLDLLAQGWTVVP